MDISKTFVVRASPATVWDLLTSPERVARCLPGASITNKIDEQTYAGTIAVKVGPVAASYKGKMTFDRLDPVAKTATIVASGQDVRGKGGADMRMSSVLVERAPGETEVQVTSHVNVIGVLAQFGQRMIQDVGDQLFDKFVGAVRAELETPDRAPATAGVEAPVPPNVSASAARVEPAANEPIELLSLGSGVAARAAGRAVRRPAVWIGAGVVLLLVYWWWMR